MKLKFGRYSGMELSAIPKSYLSWILHQPGISAETKAGIRTFLGIGPRLGITRSKPRLLQDFKRKASGDA